MRKTLDQLKRDIDDFFSDTSRSPDETREGLEEAIEHIDTKLASLDEI